MKTVPGRGRRLSLSFPKKLQYPLIQEGAVGFSEILGSPLSEDGFLSLTTVPGVKRVSAQTGRKDSRVGAPVTGAENVAGTK